MLCCLPVLSGCNHYYLADSITPAGLAEQLAQPAPEIQGLSGIVKIQIQSSVGSYQLAQKLYYKSPDKLRLEIIGIFGLPAILVLIEGEDFQLFVPVRNILIKGKTTELGPAFSINDLMAGFLYGSRLDLAGGSEFRLEENSRVYRLSWMAQGFRQQALIDKRSRIITSQEQFTVRSNTLIRQVKREKFTQAGQHYYPRLISIYDRDLKQKVTFLFSKLTFNPSLAADIFQLKLPARYEEKSLGDFLKDYGY
jgi:outer membrane lipoprotein-sorting protein